MSEATQEQRDKIWSMIKDIRFAMLISEDGAHLRARPMAASQHDFNDMLWFFTRASSHKVAEVEAHDRVCVTYADPDQQNYVSLSGQARLVRDPTAIEAHWTEGMRAWFPKGKSDPDIALLRVDIEQAEYWDAPSSTMIVAYGYAKAVLTGRSAHPGDNEKVKLS